MTGDIPYHAQNASHAALSYMAVTCAVTGGLSCIILSMWGVMVGLGTS